MVEPVALGIWIHYGGSEIVHAVLPKHRSSFWEFGVFGAIHALAATGCALPLFLGITLQTVIMSTLERAVVLGPTSAASASSCCR